MASKHFEQYVSNFNRIRLIEMIDNLRMAEREQEFRASLIANPVSGEFYPTLLTKNSSRQQAA